MASPQIENGYIQIASEIVEALARINLRPYEWRVFFFVVRKTYGFHRKLDHISVSQIAQGTGLHKQHASRARLTLLEKQVLIERGGQIGPNKNYEQWHPIGRRVTGIGDGVTGLGDEKVTDLGGKVTGTGDKTSLKQAPQKKERNYTKERGRAATFEKPTVDEVRTYAQSIKYDLDAEHFMDYYEARGWMLKNAPMKDWRAVMRTWRKRDEQEKEKQATPTVPLVRGPDGLTPREHELKRIGAA